MNLRTTIILPIVVATLMACDTTASEEAAQAQNPQPKQAQSMEGHGVSEMQGAAAQRADMEGHDMAGMENHSAGSMELHRIMAQGGDMPMPMSGDVDRDFAIMMTMHHQQAIEMADVLMQHGQDAELRALAEKMKTDQQAEIAQMAPHAK